jgi:hypothetical protein
MGINLIVNGHQSENSGKITNIHGVECTGVDFGFGKKTNSEKEEIWLRKRDLNGRNTSSKKRIITERRDPNRYTSTLIIQKENGTLDYGNREQYRI